MKTSWHPGAGLLDTEIDSEEEYNYSQPFVKNNLDQQRTVRTCSEHVLTDEKLWYQNRQNDEYRSSLNSQSEQEVFKYTKLFKNTNTSPSQSASYSITAQAEKNSSSRGKTQTDQSGSPKLQKQATGFFDKHYKYS